MAGRRQPGVVDGVEFRVVGPSDEGSLADVFRGVDETYFRPHPFTAEEARVIASRVGRDAYAILLEGGRPVAYGMLRGWDEGYPVPSLGIAVRTDSQGRGLGRLMMTRLHGEARRRGAAMVRLRVHPSNTRARRLYESLGYSYMGEDRGELVMLVALDPTGGSESIPGAVPPAITGELLDVDAPEWTSFLEATRHDFYHLPAYVALCAAQDQGEPRALHVRFNGRSMLLPLIIRSIPGGGLDATSPYGYPGPLVRGSDDPEFLRTALAAGVEVLRQAAVVSAFVRLHPLLNPAPPGGIPTVVHHGDTVSVDLSLSEEELWAQTRLNHRRDITRALRLGYTARMDETWQHLDSFRLLYRETMRRRGATSFYFFDDTYFDTLREALGGRLHLCIVEKDGEVAAAGLYAETSGIVQYHLSGTSEAARNIQPTKLMMHFVSGWAKARGDQCLHLGGGVGAGDDSLLQFKLGFSPRRHSFRTLRLVVDEHEYRRLVAAHDPDLDPADRGDYFPLYRRG